MASIDEIRTAFRARARELHSDNNSQKSLANQQAATAELAKVSEAWRVLNDPARRLEYDLAQTQFRRPQTPGPQARPHAGSGFPAARPTRESVGVSSQPPTSRPFVWVAVIGFIMGVVAILVITNTDPNQGNGPALRLQVGTCVLVVQAAAGNGLHAVDCGGPHDGVITQQIANFGPCMTNEDSYVAPGISGRLCVRPN